MTCWVQATHHSPADGDGCGPILMRADAAGQVAGHFFVHLLLGCYLGVHLSGPVLVSIVTVADSVRVAMVDAEARCQQLLVGRQLQLEQLPEGRDIDAQGWRGGSWGAHAAFMSPFLVQRAQGEALLLVPHDWKHDLKI